MTDPRQLTALARLAMLNALALALLSIQFLAPPAMVALIVVVPAIYALLARLLPPRLWALAGLTGLALALLLFGLDTGAWALGYLLLGLACGAGQRLGWPRGVRVLLTGLAAAAVLAGLLLLFGALAELDWVALAASAERIAAGLLPAGLLPAGLPFVPLAAVALLIWALIIGLGVELVSGSIFEKLRATQSGVVAGEG